jgi:hypothetical protein
MHAAAARLAGGMREAGVPSTSQNNDTQYGGYLVIGQYAMVAVLVVGQE